MTELEDMSIVDASRRDGASQIVLVCEHAGHYIPAALNDLGLSAKARFSHIAWDPGAMGVARAMSEALDAVLVSANVSRLVYDCNRPPEAPDAMPTQSEAYEIPGNTNLSDADKKARVAAYYAPFHDTLAAEVADKDAPVIVTVHSFTPIYNGVVRDVEVGVLHDRDSRLADVLLDVADRYNVQRNEPYGPEDGVTHTLKKHAGSDGHLNVMLEVRNDLIESETDQIAMGKTLAGWVTNALAKIDQIGAQSCKV